MPVLVVLEAAQDHLRFLNTAGSLLPGRAPDVAPFPLTEASVLSWLACP